MLAENNYMSKIGEFFVAYRKKHKLTQKQLANLVSIGRGNYAKIELGQVTIPLKIIKKVYKSLDNDEKIQLQRAIKEDATAEYIDSLNKILSSLDQE